MVCLPLVERELKVALRKQRPVLTRLKVAGGTVAGSALFLLLFAVFGSSTKAGPPLAEILAGVGLYFVMRAPMRVAGALAEERQNQTLGLLFLSGLSPFEVFTAKFLSSSLVGFTGLLAIFPMLALPFLMGGVSFDLYLAIVIGLPVLMFFVLAISLLGSVLARDDGAATVLASALGAALCLATPAIYMAQCHFVPSAKPSHWWLRLSPAYGPFLVWSRMSFGFSAGNRAEYWMNVAFTVLWAVLVLSVAAFTLKRIWREREVEESSTGWRGRWHKVLHGDAASRRRLATACLDLNPFTWLAARDRQPATLGWLAIGGITMAWLACWAAWPAAWPSVQNFFITQALLNVVLAWITRHTAAEAIGRGRRDGSYELLLTTPLEPADIVTGTIEANYRHFRALVSAVMGLGLLMMTGGLLMRPWGINALITYFCIWLLLLIWTWSLTNRRTGLIPVMWGSLNSGRPALAVWRVCGTGGSWMWILFSFYNLRQLGAGFRRFPTGSSTELIVVGSIAFLVSAIWLGRFLFNKRYESMPDPYIRWDSKAKIWRTYVTGGRLIREFREIVREPLPDPHDPRFKGWKMQDRFPWGAQLIQQQLHERVARMK